ncbi:histidine kinase dimerization/phospho-acceptor domain-containing protein [Thermodesulfobacteriota bacterium]
MSQSIAMDIGNPEQRKTERFNRVKLEGAIEMAGAVCHEINQPLMAISGYSKLISMNIAENDPLNEKLIKIMGQVDRLGEITQKLMRITRYETTDYLKGKIIDIDKSAD